MMVGGCLVQTAAKDLITRFLLGKEVYYTDAIPQSLEQSVYCKGPICRLEEEESP